MEGLEDVKRELEAKREELVRYLEEVRGTIEAIEKDLERVDTALASLTGKKPKAASRRTRKPAPTVDELRSIVASVRAEEAFAGEEELRKAVSARVRREGKSLAGFKDLFTRALSEYEQQAHEQHEPFAGEQHGEEQHDDDLPDFLSGFGQG